MIILEIEEKDIEKIENLFDETVNNKIKIEIASLDRDEAKKIFFREEDKFNLFKNILHLLQFL